VTKWGLTDYVARDRLFRPKQLLCAPQLTFPVLITNNFTGDDAEPVEYFEILSDGRINFTPHFTSGSPGNNRFPYGRVVQPDEPP